MRWLVAKFMPDLRRREPRNVGVVLFPGSGEGQLIDNLPILRFRGYADGKVDLRRAKVGKEGAVYEGWLQYWASLVEQRAPHSAWELRRNTDAFYLERGGELLTPLPVGTTAEDLADELYELLVETASPAQRTTDSGEGGFRDQVDSLLKRSGLWDDMHFARRYRVELSGLREHEFHYAWVNGHTTIGHRLASWRPDAVDATALRLALLPTGYSSVVIVPEYPEEAERVLPIERVSHVAAVDDRTPTDLREMFIAADSGVAAGRPIDRFEALARPGN